MVLRLSNENLYNFEVEIFNKFNVLKYDNFKVLAQCKYNVFINI